METTDSNACENCVFSFPCQESPAWVCRRHAPVARVPQSGEEVPPDIEGKVVFAPAVWPEVEPLWICGEYRPR